MEIVLIFILFLVMITKGTEPVPISPVTLVFLAAKGTDKDGKSALVNISIVLLWLMQPNACLSLSLWGTHESLTSWEAHRLFMFFMMQFVWVTLSHPWQRLSDSDLLHWTQKPFLPQCLKGHGGDRWVGLPSWSYTSALLLVQNSFRPFCSVQFGGFWNVSH